MERDPICGMNVEPETAAAHVEYGGASYYFCSKGCAKRFEQGPEKYVAGANSAVEAAGVSAKREPLMAIAPAGAERARHAVPVREAVAVKHRGHTDGGELAGAPSDARDSRYTCPMHPQIVQMGPGSCPICGMALEPMDVSAEVEADPEYDSMRRRFWVSATLALPLLVLSMFGEYLGLRLAPGVRNWIEFALATPVVLWGGWPFFERFWASLVHRSPNMFTLIGLGTGAAYLDSVVATLFPADFPDIASRGGRSRAGLF